MRPGIGDHFLAIGKVQSAGRLLTVCTGEVRAYQNPSWTGSPDSPHKLIALMQATIVNVAA
jgi:acyl-coenzyme A thioesterase PaaI-like protein